MKLIFVSVLIAFVEDRVHSVHDDDDCSHESDIRRKESEIQNEYLGIIEEPCKLSPNRETSKAPGIEGQGEWNHAVSDQADEVKDEDKAKFKADRVGKSMIDITNDYDYKIRDILGTAEALLRRKGNDGTDAAQVFSELTTKPKNSPRAWYGLAKTHLKRAEKLMSSEFLKKSLDAFQKILYLPDVPETVFMHAVQHIIKYAAGGNMRKRTEAAHDRFMDEYSDRLDLHIQLASSYLSKKNGPAARKLLKGVLAEEPDNVEARAFYGILLKSVDDNLKDAIEHLLPAFEVAEQFKDTRGIIYHLGDALNKVGRREEAMTVFDKGAQLGYFLSAVQRSKRNVDHLTGRPWWTMEQTGYEDHLKELERNWEVIRDEGVKIMKEHSVRPDDQSLTDEGAWDKLILFTRGKMVKENCEMTPRTCELVSRFEAAATCRRGQVKFSILEGGSRLLPHCGPTNCRVRAHLGLVVPPEPKIRVVNETRSWIEGKFIIFDDSFDHEVWHDGTEPRLVLIVDFWHPELTEKERKKLTVVGPTVEKVAGKVKSADVVEHGGIRAG